MANKMNLWDYIAISLLIIGGLNWGLEGIFQWNLIEFIFSDLITRIIYSLVGISGVYSIIRFIWL